MATKIGGADSGVTNHLFCGCSKSLSKNLATEGKEGEPAGDQSQKSCPICCCRPMAKCISEVQKSYACTGCAELRKCLNDAQHEKEEMKQELEAEMQDIKAKLGDLSAALQAKQLVIKDLEEKVEGTETEKCVA